MGNLQCPFYEWTKYIEGSFRSWQQARDDKELLTKTKPIVAFEQKCRANPKNLSQIVNGLNCSDSVQKGIWNFWGQIICGNYILIEELKKILLQVAKGLQSDNELPIDLNRLKARLSRREYQQIKTAVNAHTKEARLIKSKTTNLEVINQQMTLLENELSNHQAQSDIIQANLKRQISALKPLQEKPEEDIQLRDLRLARVLKDFQKAQQQITALKQKQIQLQRHYESRLNFKSSVLQNSIEAKDYLIRQLQILTKKSIYGAKILFRHDNTHFQQDFHKFVDGNPNLLVLAQTEHAIAAGYYNNTINQQGRKTQACILQLTTKQKYEMHNTFADQNFPAMSCDPYSLTFGKGQLQIVLGSLHAHSNLGKVRNGMFDVQGKKVSSLFNEGSKASVQVKSIEILQVIFEQK